MHVIIRERRESRARRAGRTEKKGEKMKRRQSRRGEGECKSNDGTLRGEKKEKKKKKMKRGTERVHRQITHVICDSTVIKERLRKEENYLSLCARHLDTKRHSVTFVTRAGWGRIKAHV